MPELKDLMMLLSSLINFEAGLIRTLCYMRMNQE